jgi:hypothetical protein
MRVNIVVEPRWILLRAAQELAARLPGVTVNGTGPCDATYYMPMSRYWIPKVTAHGLRIGWFTHAGESDVKAFAPLVQAHVAMNTTMQALLQQHGAPDAVCIRPGACRPQKPLTFGVCGTVKKDGRKGEALVAQMGQAGYTVLGHGAGWPCRILTADVARLAEFYAQIDYLVVTSLVEGGPMPLVDALAHGVPVIAPEVGWAWEYPVLRYTRGDWASLQAVLQGLTQAPTWDGWADGHRALFARLGGGVAVTPTDVPTVALAMRTCDRSPRPHYVTQTLTALLQQAHPETLHLQASTAEVAWLDRALEGLPRDRLAVYPALGAPLSPNDTGLVAMEQALRASPAAAWVLLLEDDLAFCADFVASVRRWIHRHGRADRNVYRFFGFNWPGRVQQRTVEAYDHPLTNLRASQAILWRRADALAFVTWARAHALTWRGNRWPRHGEADPRIAFDKLVAEWAEQTWPRRPGVLSWPFFVDHIGELSSLHKRGVVDHRFFAGATWRYRDGASA